MNNILKGTHFKNLGKLKIGKVRDIYIQPDKIILVSTDRHSSFDRIIAHIPFKGQVLNQASSFWFEKTKDIISNHSLAYPDPNVIVAKLCKPLPVEMVVRGYITGVTSTSLWTHYKDGKRDFGDFVLPDGLKKNQKLRECVLTPTTKSDEHDRPITAQEILKEKLVTKKQWDIISKASLRLFKRGQKIAAERGLILVDTKYEFGLDEEGNVMLIDEIHTPDSSRWWKRDSYAGRFKKAEEPEYFDKEFLRLWFKENCDPYNDPVLPKAPKAMITELSSRYIQIYEQITQKRFKVDLKNPIIKRIEKNLKKYTI